MAKQSAKNAGDKSTVNPPATNQEKQPQDMTLSPEDAQINPLRHAHSVDVQTTEQERSSLTIPEAETKQQESAPAKPGRLERIKNYIANTRAYKWFSNTKFYKWCGDAVDYIKKLVTSKIVGGTVGIAVNAATGNVPGAIAATVDLTVGGSRDAKLAREVRHKDEINTLLVKNRTALATQEFIFQQDPELKKF